MYEPRSKCTLRSMPSYLGDYERHAKTLRIPSVSKLLGEGKDISNLKSLMSTPVPCMLPLEDLLKARPEMWDEVAMYLARHSPQKEKVQPKKADRTRDTILDSKQPIPVPLNKVGKYCEDDEGNTTLPIEVKNIISTAILDSGAGVSIATKTIWVKWGKPTIRRTRMNLQLADGSLENPMGLLERVMVKSCGIVYEHTFAIVDFGKNTNYEVILGRPFMRQFKMIQDWGYNYLYLRHESIITRVNLKTHRYRDVSKSPVEEFDSGSSKEKEETLSVDKAGLWICGASCKDLNPSDAVIDRSVTDDAYVPLPFPEHLIDPQEWIHVLATLSTCALPKQTQFCDPDGYDIIPIRMIRVYLDSDDTSSDHDGSMEEYYETDHISNPSPILEMHEECNDSLKNNAEEKQNENFLPSAQSWPTESADNQSKDHVTMTTTLQHRIHLVYKISPYFYEYEDERGNFYQVIKKAWQDVDPPSTVLTTPQFICMSGKVLLHDELGNVYEMVQQLPKGIEQSRKGGAPSSTSPQGSPRVPPGFDQADSQSSRAILDAEHVDAHSQEVPEYNPFCFDCGRTHLLKDCPFYRQSHAAQAIGPPIMKTIATKTDLHVKHSHIKITLVSEKTIVFVSAKADSKINQSLLSYEVWEALGKPTLTPLEPKDQKIIGSVIIKVRIQLQPMYCTFHVANRGETTEDAILGWYWMCRTDYQADERDNTYSMKVNSLTLTGERCVKKTKETQAIQPSHKTSSRAMTTPMADTKPSTKKVTFKEPVKIVVTTTLDQSTQEKLEVQKEFQPMKSLGRGESQSSTGSNREAMTLPLQHPSTSKSFTYQEKGKAQVESPTRPQNSQATTLHKESSTTKDSPRTESHTKGQCKIYQPKYPSLREQQRRQSEQVLVPKHMLESRRLCKVDEHKWVERQATKSMHSSGWISTQRSLEAQGYHQGNRDLWLPKPEFTAYKVPSTTDLPTIRSSKETTTDAATKAEKTKIKAKEKTTNHGSTSYTTLVCSNLDP